MIKSRQSPHLRALFYELQGGSILHVQGIAKQAGEWGCVCKRCGFLPEGLAQPYIETGRLEAKRVERQGTRFMLATRGDSTYA